NADRAKQNAGSTAEAVVSMANPANGAVANFDDAAAAAGKIGIMGDEQQGGAGGFAKAEQEVNDAVAGFLIEIAGRFIGKDDARAGGKCPGNGHALLLAARQLAWIMLKAVAEPDAPELFCSARKGIGGASELEGYGDVLERGHGGNEMKGLKDDAEIVTAKTREAVFAHAHEILAHHDDLARGGAFEPGSDEKERGLAGTRRPDDSNRLAFVCGEVDPAQDLDGPGAAHEGQAKVAQGNHIGCHQRIRTGSAGK